MSDEDHDYSEIYTPNDEDLKDQKVVHQQQHHLKTSVTATSLSTVSAATTGGGRVESGDSGLTGNPTKIYPLVFLKQSLHDFIGNNIYHKNANQ